MLTGEIARRDVACILLLTALECMLHGGSMATAAPLQKEACDLLIEEQAKLDTAGVKDWLKAGPAAQDKSRIEKVRRYLEIEEDLLFRCGQYKVRTTLPRDIEDGPLPGDAAQAGSGQAAAPSPQAATAKAPEAPVEPETPKARPKQKAAAKQAGEAPSAAPAPAKAAPKAKKPKPDDAFRPEPAAKGE